MPSDSMYLQVYGRNQRHNTHAAPATAFCASCDARAHPQRGPLSHRCDSVNGSGGRSYFQSSSTVSAHSSAVSTLSMTAKPYLSKKSASSASSGSLKLPRRAPSSASHAACARLALRLPHNEREQVPSAPSPCWCAPFGVPVWIPRDLKPLVHLLERRHPLRCRFGLLGTDQARTLRQTQRKGGPQGPGRREGGGERERGERGPGRRVVPAQTHTRRTC